MSVLIGDNDCMPVLVYNKMSESPGGGLLSKWKDIARNLKISEEVIDQLSLDQGIRQMKSGEIYIEIFKAYRSEKEDGATLEKLIYTLKDMGLNDLARLLRLLNEKILRERDAAQRNPNTSSEVPAPATVGVEANESSTNPNSYIAERPPYYLDFGNKDLQTEVIPSCSPEFTRMLLDDQTNAQIIKELKALKDVFEISEINVLLTSNYKTEADRIGALMLLIEKSDDKDILKCLEKLCNLKGRPKTSKNIREKLEELFPGCVKETERT